MNQTAAPTAIAITTVRTPIPATSAAPVFGRFGLFTEGSFPPLLLLSPVFEPPPGFEGSVGSVGSLGSGSGPGAGSPLSSANTTLMATSVTFWFAASAEVTSAPFTVYS